MNRKENGNYYSILGKLRENGKMETSIVYWLTLLESYAVLGV